MEGGPDFALSKAKGFEILGGVFYHRMVHNSANIKDLSTLSRADIDGPASKGSC